MEPTPYSVLMSRVRVGAGESQLEVPEDWLQGRTLFGGLQAAVALAAMRSVAPPAPLRSMQGTFLAPVPGGPVRATARVLRAGKNVTHIEGRLVDGDNTLALFVGVFGAGRPSAVQLRPRQPVVAPENPVEMPFTPDHPAFTQHFRARWLRGGPPFSGKPSNEAVIDLGMRDTGFANEYHVLAMADFIPPIALSQLKDRIPAASLTWMLELLTDEFTALPLEGWRVDAHMLAANSGYTHQSLVLWGPGGVPVALGRQCMVVFG
jgi:acyl-coenzyme A thioesterase PaaI-like protein